MAHDKRTKAALDRFGRDVIVAARDSAIWWHDAAVEDAGKPASKSAAPDVQAAAEEMKRFAQLPPDMKRIVRSVVIASIDQCIHDLLKRLDDLGDDGAKLIVNGVEILEPARYELHGYQLLDDGWFARFSKYGEHGGPPVP